VNRTTLHLSMLLAGLLPLRVAAQESTITGRVLAADQPVANQTVALHRVTGAGGTTISVDTTAADGRFELHFEPVQGEAIHFVGTRWEGQLFIGPTFRQPPSGEYRLPVGPGATPIKMAEEFDQPSEAPADRAGQFAGLMVILVTSVLVGSIVWWAAWPRPSHARRLMLEIAELDNRHAQTALTNYEVQRSDLLRRLRESA
jgi:hypothetical protein